MKPFVTPPWRKKHIRETFKRKDQVINRAVTDMESAMKKAVAAIVDHGLNTGTFHEPAMHEMFNVSERFYRSVIQSAFESCEAEKRAQKGKRHLAAGNLPTGIPKTLRELEKVFRNKQYWPKIMKRSIGLTESLRTSYLRKLRRKFNELLPEIMAGRVSPEEAKKRMMSAWEASKSRVETIFRTETTKYFGKTQVAFFNGDPEIIGFIFDSVPDRDRTDICKSRHGLIYRPGTTGKTGLDYNTPALHWNCRSHLIALANTPYNRKLLSDPQRDPKRKSVTPLPTRWRR